MPFWAKEWDKSLGISKGRRAIHRKVRGAGVW